MGFADFIVIEDDKCKCVHCNTIVERGIFNLMMHHDNCEILKERAKERGKNMLDNFNNYKKDEG